MNKKILGHEKYVERCASNYFTIPVGIYSLMYMWYILLVYNVYDRLGLC